MSVQWDFSYFRQLIDKGVTDAVFDIDNTITKSNIGDLYMFLRRKNASNKTVWALWYIFFVTTYVPFYYTVDRFDRAKCQVLIFKLYRQYSASDIENGSAILFRQFLSKRFIAYVHDLVFYLKSQNVKIHLLSTNIEPIVREYGAYFSVPYSCLPLHAIIESETIDRVMLANFKGKSIKRFHPATTMAIADSLQDLPILSHVQYPIIVAKRIQPWMRAIDAKIIFNNKLISI